MIDLHSHILPGQDDGAQSLRDSLEMARMAVDSGVVAMVATPHCMDNRTREVYAAWKLLGEALKESGIPLRLFLGMEIFGTPDTARLLREKKLFTLNGSRYPLVEFSFQSDGQEETAILRSIRKAGYRPVVAHPERYAYVQQDPGIINRWYRMGCLLQVNRGSLMGRFGGRAQETAMELVDRGFATVVASDAHSPQMRTPWMEDVRELLSSEISPLCARVLLKDNPKRILRNEDMPPVQPEWFDGNL
jgi:protein-tyrosine phosphatase